MDIYQNFKEKIDDATNNTKLSFYKLSSFFTKNDYPYMQLELKIKLNQIFSNDVIVVMKFKDDERKKDINFIFDIIKNFYDVHENRGICYSCRCLIIKFEKINSEYHFDSNIKNHTVECILKENHNIISMYKIYRKHYP